MLKHNKYRDPDFLYQKAKEALSKSEKGLTRTEITDYICGEDFEKHVEVYSLIGKILKKYSDFKNIKGKYFLKN